MPNTYVYKIRDTKTQTYWNGSPVRSVFSSDGAVFKSRDSCEKAISRFVKHRLTWASVTVTHSLPEYWEIVELELKPFETKTLDIKEYLNYTALRHKVEKLNDYQMTGFIDHMRKIKVLDKIEFMFKLKPKDENRYHYGVDMATIKEARSQLRLLGIKTRTFRERRGVFGMMDRDQAFKARLALEVTDMVDLGKMRKELGI
jgi:hypothetical protein